MLCDFCVGICRSLSRSDGVALFIHLKETEFDESAKTCSLCRIFISYVTNHGKRDNSWPAPGPCSVYRYTEERLCRFGGTTACTALELYLPSYGGVHSAVWTKKDSLTGSKGVITTIPPLQDNNVETFSRFISAAIQSCLETCAVGCQTTISGEHIDDVDGAELPTRVLDVSPAQGQNMVTLIESKGARGLYCALSYCWGPPTQHPPKTTVENLAEHLDGISISTLPPTFRDAIALCGAIGVQYLWIDSLCIIQDDADHEDWKRESENMGRVFESAYLVMAAAYGDSTRDGLFDIARHPELTTELPFYNQDGAPLDHFYLSVLPDVEDNPCRGRLWQRGWAFQEWHLARRVVFFMRGGIRWMCQRVEYDERRISTITRDQISNVRAGSTWSWLRALSQYTGTELSYKSDRLPALQGMANEIQKIRGDQYFFGLFSQDAQAQLIWCNISAFGRSHPHDQPSLPTWSWAALGGQHDFLLVNSHSTQASFERYQPLTKIQRHPNNANILVASRGKQFRHASPPLLHIYRTDREKLKVCCIRDLWSRASSILFTPELAFVRKFGPAFALRTTGSPVKAVIHGVARFDRDWHESTYVLPLVSLEPEDLDLCLSSKHPSDSAIHGDDDEELSR